MLAMWLFVRNGCITETVPILMLLIFPYIGEGEDKDNMALRTSDDVLPVKKKLDCESEGDCSLKICISSCRVRISL